MSQETTSTAIQTDRWSYLWLLIGTVLSAFSLSIGRWIIPLTAWLSSIFILRFMRAQRKPWRGYLLLVVTTAVYVAIALPEIPARMTVVVASSLIANLIPLADRLLAHRVKGFASTLVFPLAYTALEFINTATNPLGSYGMMAYTQYGNLALMQLVSVTGMWGVVFLITWLSPIVNWVWEHSCDWPKIRRGVALYVSIMLLVLLFGQTRLWFAQSPTDTVRVAGFTAVDFRETQQQLMQAMNEDWDTFREMSAARQELYFDETIREARAGAKLVLWPEYAIPVAKEDEARLLARGQEVARQEGIYLAMSLGTQYTDDTPYEQKLLLVDPSGEIVLEHYKYGGAGFEGNRRNGDGILRTAETPYGTISAVICWDTDFPGTVLQAGRNGTDILLSPSLEFREMGFIHAQMAIMRAIENGVSVVRVADNGVSVVADPYGRVLATMDHFTAGQRTIVAQVPTQGVSTLCPVIGDLFGWVAVVGFLVLTVWVVVRQRGTGRARLV